MDVNGQSWDSKTGRGAPHRSSQSPALHPFVAFEVSRITSTSFHGRAPASIIPLPTANATEDFENRIRQFWSRGSGHTLELAMAVRDARRQLRHGQWAALFQSGRMPFSHRQADRLICVARLAWLNQTSRSCLPRSWSSLYLLARLDRPILEDLIAQGQVHPALSLREVRELVARFNGLNTRVQPEQPGVRRRVERFREFVLGGCADWSPGQRQWTRDELLLLAHQLETSNGSHPSQSQSEGDPS